jgi:ribosome-binding protein aMBF1 (putative translation factor)
MNQLLERDTSFPTWLTLSWAWEQSLDDPTAVKSALARNLRTYREDRGLSQKRLAKRAGTTLAVIRSIESGRDLPDIATLLRLAEALGVCCATLVECGVRMTTAPSMSKPASTRPARHALA